MIKTKSMMIAEHVIALNSHSKPINNLSNRALSEPKVPATLYKGTNSSSSGSFDESTEIRDVWLGNFFVELETLSALIDQDYTLVAFVSI